MTAQTLYMPGFVTKAYTASFEEKGLKSLNGGSCDWFKELLDRASYRTDTSDGIPAKDYKTQVRHRDQDVNVDSGRRFKSYREVSLNSRYETKQVSNGNAARMEENEGTAEPDDSEKKKAEAAVESLARILGIGNQELIKLMKLAGIAPEDVTDASKAGEVAGKLAALTGLTKEEEHALFEVINRVSTAIKEQMRLQNNKALYGDADDGQGGDLSLPGDALQQNGDNIEVEVMTDRNLQELMAEFKLKLQLMRQKLHENPQEFTSDVAGVVSEVMGEAEASAGEMNKAVPGTRQEYMNADANQVAGEVKGERESMQDESSTDAGMDDGGAFDGFFMEELAAAGPEAENSNGIETSEYGRFYLSNITASQQDKAVAAGSVASSRQEIYVPKSEIISQVVEKAKVILDGEKSEMVMSLKPDSLGKLSLKIVTEHGMVTAKFIAESQQVKQILEANMQILKDLLEKQGMSIQGFSVYVGHQASYGNNGSKDRSETGKTGALQSVYTAGNAAEILEIPVIRHGMNPYGWEDSKINLTV